MNYFIKLQKSTNQFQEVNFAPAEEIYLKRRNCRTQKINLMSHSFNVTQNFGRLARHFLRVKFSFSSLRDFK